MAIQFTTRQIKNSAITSAKIADDAVTTAKIADNAITNALMADAAVDTAELAANAVTAAKMDLTDTFDFTSGTVSVAAPTADAHAATKSYVDNAAVGLYWKQPVRAHTTSNITLSGTQTIDGVSVVSDDRVLVKSQTDASENGIYVAAAGSWSRSSDMDASDEFSGTAVFVKEGTLGADTAFVCTNDTDVTVGTTDVAFVQFAGNGTVQGGDGIAVTGTSVAVDLATTPGLEFSSGKLQAKIKANSGIGLDGTGLSVLAKAGIQIDSADGNLKLRLDGLTLAQSASGVKVADGGVDTTQLADDAVTLAKVGWTPEIEVATGDNSATAFTLAQQIDSAFYKMILVHVNGQHAKYVASSPADASEYAVDDTGSATRITFGAAPDTGDALSFSYIY